MADDFHIRRATPEDEAGLLDLLRLSMGEDAVPWTPAFWRWKHIDNPFGVSPVLLAEADGQIVGLRAFMRWSWQSGEQAVSAVRAVDTATHPEYRGRGIFKRLTVRLRDELGEEGVGFVFNTPNAQSRPGYLKMGWVEVGKPTLWLRPVRPVRLVRALRAEGLGGEERNPPPVDADPAAEVLGRPGVVTLTEAAALRNEKRYHTVPTLDYLRWRYADIPGFAYQALSRGEGADGALAVVRSRSRGAVRELRVCDLVVGPTAAARRNARALLRALPGVADVEVVLTMRPPALPPSVAARAGYLPAPRTGPILTAYPLAVDLDLPDPRDLGSWQPQVGAFELF